MAEEAGLSLGYIGQVESGRINPSLKALNKIAKALKLDPGFLIEEENGVLLDEYKVEADKQGKVYIERIIPNTF